MHYKHILLTGSTGTLGSAIRGSGLFPGLLTPGHKVLDITGPGSVQMYFKKNKIDAVIHCAAMARISACEKDPAAAMATNMIGTCNLVNALLSGRGTVRFIHISTDGVYPGTKGHYSEEAATIPYNKYGWTKLGAECAVNLLKNFCILRTNFFDPENIKFAESARDIYTSKMELKELVKAIKFLLASDFVGTVNVGGRRGSDYRRYKKFKPELKACTYKDIARQIPFKIYSDASLDTSLLRRIKNG